MIVIGQKLVDDPGMAPAEVLHQRELKPDSVNLGKVYATVNLREILGGFCRYKDTTAAQQEAVRRFKSIYEGMQVGGARAVDLTQPIVDTSFSPATINMVYGEQAKQQYRGIVRDLGAVKSSLIEKVVIYDRSQRSLADDLKLSRTSGGQAAVKRRVLEAVDELSRYFKL